jgi:2-desacetyl-2-hydroxyethyl bacteriochlorophyllide A dehydrogenase
MKALVLERYNELVYKEVDDPHISANEVLVKVKACGICGSDVHGLDGSTGRRQPPIIMGHEASGEIISVGSQVKNWKTADRVTFDSTVYNLNDWYTLEGQYNLSDNREVMGVSADDFKRHGAFAEYVAIPEHILYKIPDKVSFEEAAMVEPVAVALHAVRKANPQLAESCVVVGAGMIGIFLVKLLSHSGLANLIAIDLNEKKREQAAAAGANFTFDPNDKNLLQELLNKTKSRGADFSIEAVGIANTVDIALQVLRKGGRTVLVGNISKSIDFPLQRVVTRELTVLSSCAIRGEYEAVLNLIEQGTVSVRDQISEIVPLSEGAKWFDRLRQKNNGLNKVILVP